MTMLILTCAVFINVALPYFGCFSKKRNLFVIIIIYHVLLVLYFTINNIIITIKKNRPHNGRPEAPLNLTPVLAK